MLTDDEAWMARAACLGSDQDEFFPGSGISPAFAREVCGACPVAEECLDYALAHHITAGIWGGMSVRERRRLERCDR